MGYRGFDAEHHGQQKEESWVQIQRKTVVILGMKTPEGKSRTKSYAGFDIRGMRAPEGDCSRTRRRREGRKVRCDVKYISVRHHLGWSR